jgi:muramoyltetrapeptide carboxypeptidase LdcA involved in peptidoglycan recycling
MDSSSNFFLNQIYNQMDNKKIEQAKALLEEAGYFTRNLWHVDDVKGKFKCTDEQAQEVLDDALTNDATMEQIWLAIGIVGESKSLTEINQD